VVNNLVTGQPFSENYPQFVLGQSDGKILVGGSTANQFAVTANAYIARFNQDGSFDTDFSEDGIFMQDFFVVDLFRQGKLLDDGKILVTMERSSGIRGNCSLARLNPDGTLDTTYGEMGIANIALDDGRAYFHCKDPIYFADGSVLLTTRFRRTSGDVLSHYLFRKVNRDGMMDMSFGTGGTLRLNDVDETVGVTALDNSRFLLVTKPTGASRITLNILPLDGKPLQGTGLSREAEFPSTSPAVGMYYNPQTKTLTLLTTLSAPLGNLGHPDFVLVRLKI
jgi:uncharacterized delta-60 repeat protein